MNTVKKDEKREIICSTCHIKFNSVTNYKLHLQTEFHIYNTKRRIAELPPISEEVFEQKREQMVSANASLVSEVTYKCFPCNKSFKSLEMLDEHKKSKKHKKNEKEYMKKHPDASDSSIFKSISHNQSEKGEEKNTANILDGINEEIQSSAGFSIVGEQESKNGEKIHQKTTLDSLRVCLFCNKESDGVKKNIDHMRIKHSFTILDIDCLVDLKGLLTYMAQRIHIGKICLFCSKQFKDARSCQQHMMDCGHCMMNMEDEDEYVDFYDFSKTYQNHPLMIQEKGDSI